MIDRNKLGKRNMNKGKRGELDIAKLLTIITHTKWHRVPNSGAFGQTQTQFKGDVYTDHPDYKNIVVEVKNQSGHTTFNEQFKPKSRLNGWVKQLKEEKGADDLGILFFKSGVDWCWRSVAPPILLWERVLGQIRAVSLCKREWGLIDKTKLKLMGGEQK